MNGYWI